MSSKKWLLISFITILSTFCFLIITIFILNTKHNIPYRLSNSISYDAKLDFLRKNKQLLEDANTIVIGSSMGLNNIDSDSLDPKFKKVINISSWGLQVDETFQLLKLINLTNKKYVIYSTQYVDFTKIKLKDIKEEKIKNYIYNNSIIISLFNTLSSLTSNINDTIFFKKKFLNKNSYRYLKFDKNGDINLNFDNKSYIKKDRWSEIEINKINNETFNTLIEMNTYLNSKNIKLIVISNPIRKKIVEKNSVKKTYSNYTQKLIYLSKLYGFKYQNMHDLLSLDDTYFVDKFHLNYKGAKIISEKIE